MKPMKLFHIRSSYFYGGPERQITYLTRALGERGVPSGVATFAPADDPERNRYFARLQELGIPAYRIDIRGSYDRSATTTLERIIADGGYTVLIGHDYRADYFVLQLAGRLDLPAASFSRGWTRNTLKVRLYECLDRRFLKKMDGVVAVSRKKYDELARKGIDRDRLIHIPNSIPTGERSMQTLVTRKRFKIPHNAFLVGTAGRLSVEKRQDIFIEAAIDLLNRHGASAPWFMLAGEGPRRDRLAAMIPRKYRRRIILAGWIKNTDDFYADLDLFVLTSATEGFPNVLLEAGKYHLPAISTPAGGAVDIIEHGQSGLLFDFGDTDALARHIESLANDADRRKRLGDRLAEITRETYDSKLNADRLWEFLNTVRERHGQA
jgi:glycosyltransferase involved in cell wall biosynthesis